MPGCCAKLSLFFLLFIFSSTLAFNSVRKKHSSPILTLSKARVKFIDTFKTTNSNNNYLFRGPEPVDSGNFSYNALASAFTTAAAKKNITLPSNYYLIDFNLLSYEWTDIDAEKAFFKSSYSRLLIFTFLTLLQIRILANL